MPVKPRSVAILIKVRSACPALLSLCTITIRVAKPPPNEDLEGKTDSGYSSATFQFLGDSALALYDMALHSELAAAENSGRGKANFPS